MLGGWEPCGSQHLAECPALLGEVDRLRAGTDDRHSGVLEGLCQAQRGLSTQLDDHPRHRPGRPLGVDYFEHVFQGQRLEIQPVGCVVVGGDGLRIAVDHDRFVAGSRQRHRGVDARVVELDALADPVGSASQDQDRGPGAGCDLGLKIIRAVVVGRPGRELGCAGVDGLVDRAYAERPPYAPDDFLAQVPDGGDLRVGEAVPLGKSEQIDRELGGGPDRVRNLVEQHQLVDEPGIDLGRLVHLVRTGTSAQGLHHHAQPAIVRPRGALEQCPDGR